MKFAEPLESQKLSSLLERAVSREAKLWKVYVPKKPTNQVSPSLGWLISGLLTITKMFTLWEARRYAGE